MAVSLEEMMGQMGGGQSSQAPQPKGAISLEQMTAQQPPAKPSLGSKVVSAAVQPAKDYWSKYTEITGQYLHQVKTGFGDADKAETILGQLSSAAKGWLGVMGAAWAPIEAGVDTLASEPMQHAVNLAGEQISKLAPEKSDNPAVITKADIQRTVEGINQLVDTGLQTAAGFVMPVGEVSRASGLTKGAISAEEMSGAVAKEIETTIEPKGGATATPKPRVRVTPEGTVVPVPVEKPRVRVTPEGKMVQVSEGMHSLNEELRGPVHETPSVHPALEDWQTIQGRMAGVYQQALEAKTPLPAHGLLDQMIRYADEGPAKSVLTKIRQYVDNVPVHFVEQLPANKYKGKIPETATGLYHATETESEVYIKPKLSTSGGVSIGGTATESRHIAHELVHAATVKFIHTNPEHPLVKELESLRLEAKAEVDAIEARTGSWPGHYGLSNSKEFVAEALSNPKFQKFLTSVSSKSLSLWNRLASVIGRMFGANTPQEQNFLHRVMTNAEELMKAQKRMSAQGDHDVIAFAIDEDHKPITRGQVIQAARKIPGIESSTQRIAGYVEELTRALNPEALGSAAKTAASVISRRVGELMHNDAIARTGSKERRDFWRSNPEEVNKFIDAFERGEQLPGKEMAEMRYRYRSWNHNITVQDAANGIHYEPKENYLYHAFEKGDEVAKWFEEKFGKKWGDPKFTKDRVFELYKQARDAGFKPLYDNPEDLMLARQHASDVAEMQSQILKDLEQWGLAKEVVKGEEPPKFAATRRRSPNGSWYWVDNHATQVLHNAFDTTSLWSAKGLKGDLFRGAMAVKNLIVPIRLAISGFHPLHVIHIDNAAATSRAWKDMLAGTKSPLSTFKEMLKSATLYRSFWENPKAGSRLIQAWDGRIAKEDLTSADAQSLRYMLEGGFTPHLSQDFKTNALQNFRTSLRTHSAKALWQAPLALLDAMRYPIFDVWIPNLKAASFNAEAESLMRARPELAGNDLQRQLGLRKIAKSVDNRYGEMNYNSLFWPRWFKDLMVANTLSLGWQMGFMREFGGGAIDAGQFIKGTDRVQRIKAGALDRPLFASSYVLSALGYGGLLTWGLSGQAPQGIYDYIFPRTGKTDASGKPERVNTMFYTREFASIWKHVESEGLLEGMSKLASSKASGLIGLASELTSGVNSFGQNIRNPDDPMYKQIEQKLVYALSDLEPISVQQMKSQDAKGIALSSLGFTPAPKYITDSKTEARIKLDYGKYVQPKETTFERLRYGGDFAKLKKQYSEGDEGFGDSLDKFMESNQITSAERRRIFKALRSDTPPTHRMFSKLPWEVQKHILDQMSEDEREEYIPLSDKQHLRHRYEAPR